MAEQGLTEQQRKWMASVRTSLPEKTGRPMDEWVAIARTCPETKPRARQKWFKEHHGLGVNYFSFVEHEMRTRDGGNSGAAHLGPAEGAGAVLWRDPAAAEVFRAIEAMVAELPDVVSGQRKGFSSFSRRYAFAAARPVKQQLRLGLALPTSADPRLEPARNEGWSERLTAVLVLADREAVGDGVGRLLRQAWERS